MIQFSDKQDGIIYFYLVGNIMFSFKQDKQSAEDGYKPIIKGLLIMTLSCSHSCEKV
jgi:hypothetical protein